MIENKASVSEMVEDLARSTEWLDPKKLDEKIDEIHEQLDLEQADNFIRAMAAVESAWLKDELVDTQVLELHAKIKVLMEERLTEKSRNYIETIDQTLLRYSSLAVMMGFDKKDIPNPYQAIIEGSLAIPEYSKLKASARTGHSRLILVPPWDRKEMIDRFPPEIAVFIGIEENDPKNRPLEFHFISTRFDTSNYLRATDSGMTGVDVTYEELEGRVKRWHDAYLDQGLDFQGLTINDYILFELDGLQHINAGFKEFKHMELRDLEKPCVLFGEKDDGDYMTWALALREGINIYQSAKTTIREFKTRLAIHFDQDNGKIIDEEER